MDTRPCGHPLVDPLLDERLECSRPACGRRIVACVVFVSAVPGDPPGWRIQPACRLHLKLNEDTAKRARHPEHPGVYRFRPKLAKVLDWLHDDAERCGIGPITIGRIELDPDDAA